MSTGTNQQIGAGQLQDKKFYGIASVGAKQDSRGNDMVIINLRPEQVVSLVSALNEQLELGSKSVKVSLHVTNEAVGGDIEGALPMNKFFGFISTPRAPLGQGQQTTADNAGSPYRTNGGSGNTSENTGYQSGTKFVSNKDKAAASKQALYKGIQNATKRQG